MTTVKIYTPKAKPNITSERDTDRQTTDSEVRGQNDCKKMRSRELTVFENGPKILRE